MRSKELEGYLSTFMCAESDFPFGPEALVYKIKGKMFAIIAERNGREYVSEPSDKQYLLQRLPDHV